MSRLGRRRGKAAERKVAQLLNGRRILRKGLERTDVETNELVVEVKTRMKPPTKQLRRWLGQAKDDPERGDRLPILVIHGVGEAWVEALVVMSFADFQTMMQNVYWEDDRWMSKGPEKIFVKTKTVGQG